MTFMEFRDAVFEVADLWTPTVDAEEYAKVEILLCTSMTLPLPKIFFFWSVSSEALRPHHSEAV